MLSQGLIIMVTGMTIVFVFLLILLCVTKLSSAIIIGSEKRVEEAESAKPEGK